LSVHTETRADGAVVFTVRWRDGGRGSPNRKRTFDNEDDARDFDRRVRRLKQTGDPALFADEITLAEYVHGEWWPNYAERRLALSTQESHSTDLDLGILQRLGDLPLTQLRPNVVERFAADLEQAGAGRATIVSTLAVLQGVMKRAVRDYNLTGNPVKQIDKPSQRRDREPVLISVEQVEAMRHWCLPHQPPRLRRPAPRIRGPATALGRDPATHDPVPSNQTWRTLRTRDPAARPAGRRSSNLA
jgi:integrase